MCLWHYFLEVPLVGGDWLEEAVPGRWVPRSLFFASYLPGESSFALAHASSHEFLPRYSPRALELSDPELKSLKM